MRVAARAAWPASPSRQARDQEETMMKTRLALPVLLLALLALVPAAPAAALDWGLGADFGYSIFMPDYDDAENVSSISMPFIASPSMGEYVIPTVGGLRLSFAGENRMHEVWLGTSLARMSVEDFSLMTMQLSGNYQFNFAAQGAFKPYLTAGVGMIRLGASDDDFSHSAMSTCFGGGAGVAHQMGSGRLRGEVRYDMFSEGLFDGGEYPVLPKGSGINLKLGFDLWNK
jgi:hypothetical protein